MPNSGSIDPVSRHRAVRFAFRLCCLLVLVFGPCLAGRQTFQGAAAVLTMACGIGGFVSMVFARMRGEPLWQGSLNGWDEALALVAVSRLAHFAMGFTA
jgi:hypothetical protein